MHKMNIRYCNFFKKNSKTFIWCYNKTFQCERFHKLSLIK